MKKNLIIVCLLLVNSAFAAPPNWSVGLTPFSNYVNGYHAKIDVTRITGKNAIYAGIATHLFSKYGQSIPRSIINRNAGVVDRFSDRLHFNFGYQRVLYTNKSLSLGGYADLLCGTISWAATQPIANGQQESLTYGSSDRQPTAYAQLTIGGFTSYSIGKRWKIQGNLGIGESIARAPVYKDKSRNEFVRIADHLIPNFSISIHYKL